MGASFTRPCATSKQKKLCKLIKENIELLTWNNNFLGQIVIAILKSLFNSSLNIGLVFRKSVQNHFNSKVKFLNVIFFNCSLFLVLFYDNVPHAVLFQVLLTWDHFKHSSNDHNKPLALRAWCCFSPTCWKSPVSEILFSLLFAPLLNPLCCLKSRVLDMLSSCTYWIIQELETEFSPSGQKILGLFNSRCSLLIFQFS